MQNKIRSRSKRQRRAVVAIFTILVTALLVLSVLIIPRAISTYAVSNNGPNPHYVPSNAFGDSDDLPASSLKSAARGLAAGSSSVSGTVIDASTGQPVANALQWGLPPSMPLRQAMAATASAASPMGLTTSRRAATASAGRSPYTGTRSRCR